ncbi:MAG: GNAT family N-acetyltransferase, partial [Candidatus Atribacteria bacterium]|nr:GNAT family N-acetyltransferase [Candidatus Atribacteria bacterium]
KKGNSNNSGDFAKLIVISAPLFFPALLGPHLDNFIENVYKKPGNLFSHEHAWFAEIQGKTTGMLLGYSGEVKRNQGLSTGLLFFKHFIKFGFFQKIIFLLKTQNFFPKIKRDDFYISNLAVFPEYQNRGIGTSLLKFAESEALSNRCVNMVLDVEAENQRAIKLYQKNGYVMESTSSSLQFGKSQFQFIRMKKYLIREITSSQPNFEFPRLLIDKPSTR